MAVFEAVLKPLRFRHLPLAWALTDNTQIGYRTVMSILLRQIGR